ncbi:Low temperature requirement protein LtrA [Ruminococcaceae bacterium P7]|nr:Low temperature requirement protein LtrA [Ruminococcaceae bacterium P7]
MIREILQPKEKKVEYIELIYDLIFVYIIGRNNQLLHIFDNGFVTMPAFLSYVMTTLAIIQIWNYSTYYINVYGRHSVREHIFMFVNMFLLYFIGEGTRTDWQAYHTQYHIAWALILINIGTQYLLELRNQKDNAHNRKHIVQMAVILFIEAAMVASDIFFYQTFGNTWMSLAAILFGMGAVLIFGQKNSADVIDFPHLSERAMLYVVFTFGEMIIAISSYFEGGFSVSGTYFALMAFLIVVGLFLSYGVFYDNIIDRDKRTNGLGYMLLHIFLIFSMNNITNGLEFMRETEISLIPKILFLIGSLILYFICLFALGNHHAKARCSKYNILFIKAGAISAVFITLMLLLRENMMINIFITVAFVFVLFLIIYKYGKRINSVNPKKET